MTNGPEGFLPGISDYVEFRHMKKNAKEVDQSDKPESNNTDDEIEPDETEDEE